MIKVIPNQKPWEVMKAYEERTEDKPVRVAYQGRGFGAQLKVTHQPVWDWRNKDYFIIDDTQPELTAE